MVCVNGMKHAQATGLGGVLQLALLILSSNLSFCEDFLQKIYMTNEWNELQSCIAETSDAVNRICQHELQSVQQIAPPCYRALLSCLMLSYSGLKRIPTKESVSLAMVQAGFPSSRPVFCYALLFLQVIHIDKIANLHFLNNKIQMKIQFNCLGFYFN